MFLQVPVSPESSNPAAWNQLFQTLGFEGGLVIFMLVIGLVVFIFTGYILYRVAQWVLGQDGWAHKAVQELMEPIKEAATQFRDSMPKIQDALTQRNEVQEKQMGLCQEHKSLVVTTVKHQLTGLREMADKIEAPEASREFTLALDAIK